MKRTVSVPSEHENDRLDRFLHEHVMPEKSRSHIQMLIRTGLVTIGGKPVKTGYALKKNDTIEIEELEPKELELEALDLDLDIVYEDDDLLVINKPEGLVVHPAESHRGPTLVHGLLDRTDSLSSINGVIRPGIVHRIDKDTSGLLVVAKHDRAHVLLSQDLAEHRITRKYVALCYGHFKEATGTIDAPIRRHPKNRLKMAVLEGGKPAVTHFEVVERFRDYTLIHCRLETGRTHQIRVHMAYIGHPLVGDPLYGPRDRKGDTGQFLHAYELSFFHPIKKEHMTFTVDVPESFKSFLNRIR
ncbi:MAG: RluA family pseudouridine synthase [Acholeplasmataceae bacterium]